MLYIICYDVTTDTSAGRKRLRRVAKACEAVGQRVQKSVFECKLNLMQFESLERTLLDEIDPQTDCLRVYRITEPVDIHVREYGNFKATDFDGPLVV